MAPRSSPKPTEMELLEAFRTAISSETGFDLGDAHADVSFEDIGLDPFSAIAVIDMVTSKTGVELPASLFRDCTTVSQLAAKLGCSNGHTTTTPPPTSGASVREAFAHASSLIPRFAEESGTARFWTDVYPAQKQLVLAYVCEAFAHLGSPLDAMPAGTVVSHPGGIQAKHRRLFDGAIFDILADGGLVVAVDGGRRHVRTGAPVDKTPSAELHAELVRRHPAHANTHRLLAVTGARLAGCLTGAADPIKLLFGSKHNKDLLRDFYTNAPMSAAASRQVAAFLGSSSSLPPRGAGSPVRILEIGAGMGGTTGVLLDALAAAGVPFRYTFTDVSASFFAAARARYSAIPPLLPDDDDGSGIEYLVLDVEKRPPAALAGRFDAVVSANCIHATKRLAASCANARRLLRPGGVLVLVEFTRRLYWLDLVFGLLDGWWLFEDGRRHCTVDEAAWEACLKEAGFGHVLWAAGGERPNPQVLVACTDTAE